VSRIGRYDVEREIGSGAGGAVFLAHDPRLDRNVAIKIIRVPGGLSAEDEKEFRARFAREAHAAAALSHPGIVTVYDAGEDEATGAPFLAMEYVPGRTLRQVLDAEGSLAPERACTLAGRVAEALHAAHAAGVVHRDVKPANLLVLEGEDAIKIVDFGIARLGGSVLTRTDLTLGSPAYMSPEQTHGGTVDGRSDLFSLASILYEALTGTRPFPGDDIPAVLYAIVHTDPVPPSQRRPELTPAFDAFFERALAKDPDRRFPTGAAFKESLDDALRGIHPVATEVPPAPARRRLPRRWIAAACMVVAVGAVVLHWSTQRAWLRLQAKSSMHDASLSLLVDGREVYERELAAPEKPGALRRLIDPGSETFEAWIRVRPGKREIAAVVTPAGAGHPSRDSIVVELEPGEKRRLRLVAGRTLGTPVSLKLD
jgi:tRNA A-37 threonylcarbamoyl transferase component Bud32